MNEKTWSLLVLRFKSLFYNISAVVVAAVLGYFMSPEFATWLSQFSGSQVWASLIALILPEIIKHFRNVAVISAAIKADPSLGARGVAVGSQVTLL